MLKAVKQSVHRMMSHLQLISSYLEMEDYAKALGRTKETIKEMHALEATLTGLANVGMTVPKNGAVVVPHGSTVVSHEDKKRFGSVHMADRPVFHTPQILNVIRLVVRHSSGSEKTLTDVAARYKLGAACLMMNDLLLTKEEESAISIGPEERRMQALMTQMLGPFEVVNTAAITHIVYRSRIMFHVLLNDNRVVQRITKECQGFDFAQEFSRVVGMPLKQWLFLLFAFYAYLSNYLHGDGTRRHEFLAIDRTKFRGESKLTPTDLDIALRTLSVPLDKFAQMLNEPRPTDWRFDFVPFKAAGNQPQRSYWRGRSGNPRGK